MGAIHMRMALRISILQASAVQDKGAWGRPAAGAPLLRKSLAHAPADHACAAAQPRPGRAARQLCSWRCHPAAMRPPRALF